MDTPCPRETPGFTTQPRVRVGAEKGVTHMAKQLKRHPLSAAWTDMSAEENAALKADIEANGVLQPIVLHGGMILDGWHRYTNAKAIDEAFNVPAIDLPEGSDPADFVVSQNLLRRHLTGTQRATCVLEVRSWRPAGALPKDGKDLAERAQERTNKELADEAGVSPSVVSAVKRRMRQGHTKKLKTGDESLASLRKKETAGNPMTPIEKLRDSNTQMREELKVLREEVSRLREAVKDVDENALQKENEVLRGRVKTLQEKLTAANKRHKAAVAAKKKMAQSIATTAAPKETPAAS